MLGFKKASNIILEFLEIYDILVVDEAGVNKRYFFWYDIKEFYKVFIKKKDENG